ncbi:MAG: radical SAM protein [Proteobacteria bacterium]|nr:radical SAM protein [Pseudomonadota bacterium]MBU1641075.1 radical SAM protein [Pseudomonadota bacterium]
MLVSELFYSIQGESSYAGYPCLFIRLAGCNLRCTYCDAKYTYEETDREMSLAEIVSFVRKSPVHLVEITGGEPLLQKNVYTLMETLLADDRTVLLETNGSIDLAKVPDAVVKIMDIKCPGSGMAEMNRLANLQQLTSNDELKFVLRSKEDYIWAVDFLREHKLCLPHSSDRQTPKIIFSAVTRDLDPADLAAWLLADGLPIRLQLQLHTLLWPDKTRGV